MTNNTSRPSISNSKLASVLIVTSALLIGCLSSLIIYGLSENSPDYIRHHLLLMSDHLQTGLSNSLHNIDMFKEKIDCAFSSSRKDYCGHQTVRDHLDLLDSLGPLSIVLFLPLPFMYCIKAVINGIIEKIKAVKAPEPPCACVICKFKPTCVPEKKCDIGAKCVPQPTCDPESKHDAEQTCDPRPKCDAEPESNFSGNPTCDTNISTCGPEPKCDAEPICDPEPKCDAEPTCDTGTKCGRVCPVPGLP